MMDKLGEEVFVFDASCYISPRKLVDLMDYAPMASRIDGVAPKHYAMPFGDGWAVFVRALSEGPDLVLRQYAEEAHVTADVRPVPRLSA